MNRFDDLARLIDAGIVLGMKVETESEGMDWSSIAFLSSIASNHDLEFDLKIGGCEAKTDIQSSQSYDISGIIAPMIETKFAAFKFGSALRDLDLLHKVKPKLLIETVTGVLNIHEILTQAEGWVSGINFGRSDLLASLKMDLPNVTTFQDSRFEATLISGLIAAKERGFQTTFGGGLTVASIKSISPELAENLPDKFESRRFIFDAKKLFRAPEMLMAGLRIEKEIVESLFEISLGKTRSLSTYLGELQNRIEPYVVKKEIL